MQMRRTSTAFLFPMLLSIAALFVGCSGGNGPSLPSPDRTGDDDTVETESFVVEAGDTYRCDTNTVIECDTARIDGEVIGADGSGPGEPGVSITIQSAGDVVVNGTVRAGNGGPASDAPGQMSTAGDQTSGGDGGSIAIIVSAEQSAESAGKQSDGPGITLGDEARLLAGDGADGGASLIGGAGGHGGGVVLTAEGTVHVPAVEGIIHAGNGGHGGAGGSEQAIPDGVEFPDEAPRGGGDGGQFTITTSDLTGLQIIGTPPDAYADISGGVVSGGNGGNSGGIVFPELSDTAQLEPTGFRPQQDGDDLPIVAGKSAGSACAPGTPGNADAVEVTDRSQIGGVKGGMGGHLDFHTVFSGGAQFPALAPDVRYYTAGNGGDATHEPPNAPDRASCGIGRDGLGAYARGGDGGSIFAHLLRDDHVDLISFYGGDGGDASAIGGAGADGGDCCDGDSAGPAPDGGAGGSARAIGGDCGWQQGIAPGDRVNVAIGIESGDGGDAYARGGQGGDGGDIRRDDGAERSSGGNGGSPEATPGDGSPPGKAFTGTVVRGSPGDWCPGLERFLIALNETVSGDGVIKILTDFWPISAVLPQQEGAIELGGGFNSVYPLMGQTIALTQDASRLFVSTTEHAVFVYDNPLAGGQRDSDFKLTPSGEPDENYRPEGIYYDHVRDILYVHGSVGFGGSEYHAWHDASTIADNRPADRTLDPNNVGLPGSAITGDPEADRLFIPGDDRVLVIDNASSTPGDVEFDADRRIDVDTDQRMGQGIAYDATRDRLYTGTTDFGYAAGDDCQLVIIEGASTADGLVEPEVLTGISDIDHWPLTMHVVPDGDALLVGFNRSDLVMFRNASALASGPAPEPDERLDTVNVNAMGAVYLSQ